MTRTCRSFPASASAQWTWILPLTRPTSQQSSPRTRASTTRRSRRPHRCWSTSAASPEGSTPRTWYASNAASPSVGLFEPGAFLMAFDHLGDQLLHVGVAGGLDVAGLIGLAVAAHGTVLCQLVELGAVNLDQHPLVL